MKQTSAVLALAALATSAVAAVDIRVVGSGSTSLDNNFNRVPFDIEEVTGPGGAKSISGSGHQQIFNTAFGVISDASGSGSAFADAGVLRVRVDGVAIIGPGAPNVPTVTHGTPRVNASFGASFADSVELKSGTLPVGAPASFRATITMSVLTNEPGHVGPAFGGYDSGTFAFTYFVGATVGGNYFFPNGLFTTVPEFSLNIPVEISGKVGDIISVGASLGAGADNRAGFFTDVGGGLSTWGGLSQTHIDASHTAQIFLDPITPGIELVAESGHNYSISAVPEPEAYLLLLAGLAWVGVVTRWSRRQQRS